MQRKTRRIIAAVAVIALLAAGGAAFTASIGGLNGDNANIGFGSETVTGATATGVNYALSTDGQFVDQVTVTLTGDYSTTDHPGYAFKGSLTDGSGTDGAGVVVETGTCTPDTTYTAPSTTLTCDFTSGGAGGGAADTGVATTSVNGFQLAVTGNDSSGTTSSFNGT